MIFTILTYLAIAIVVLLFLFFYQFYFKPRMLMRYYEKQGVKHKYFQFLLGRFGQYESTRLKHNDYMYITKHYLQENPDCKYYMTNLASYVQISFYDPKLIKEFYNHPDIDKHKFGVEIFNTLINGFTFDNKKEHSRKRKIISQVFHYGSLQNLLPNLCDIVDEFVESIRDKRIEDTIFACQNISADATTRLFFGNQLVNQQYNGKSIPANVSYTINQLGVLSSSAIYCLFGLEILKFGSLKQLKKDSEGLKKFFKQILLKRVESANIEEIKKKERKDLIDFLVENELIKPVSTENSLTIEEVIEEFITFYLGGMDTTGHQMGMIFYYLCVYPECKEKLIEEIEQNIKSSKDINNDTIKNMKYLNAFVTESIRYFTIADQIFVREAKKDIQIGDLKILKGTMLNVGIMENHYNPKYFKDPNEFNPMRWLDGSTDKLDPFIFIPFSSGRNNCIGQHFAQLEMKNFDLILDSSYKLSMGFKFLSEPVDPIPITFKQRQK